MLNIEVMRILRSDLLLDGYELLNFINLKEKELETIRNWRNHPNVRKWMYSQHEISKEEHRKFVESLKKSTQSVYWMIRMADKHVGVLYLNRVNFEQRHAYFGIYANPFNKIPGAGSVLCKLAIKLVFKILSFHTLKLEVMEDNEKAINLYKKFGFREEGRLREFVRRGGKWIDVVIMGMVNPFECNQDF